MSRCTVCRHAKHALIDRQILAGRPAAEVAQKFNLNPRAVQRHVAAHLRQAVQAEANERVEAGGEALSLLATAEGLLGRVQAMMDHAEARGDLRAATGCAKELRGCLELLGKLTGGIAAPSATINLVQAPEFAALQARIMMALRPFPDASRAVAQALAIPQEIEHV